MTDIKRLLKKKSWTGEEVGRVLIASYIHDVKRKGGSKPLLTQEEFNRMEASLNDQSDLTAYGVFCDIYNSIVYCYNKGQGLYQQFYNGFHRYCLTLEMVKSADRAIDSMDRYPLIMTQSQYDRIQKAVQDKKRATKASYRFIIFDMLIYYTGGFTNINNSKRREILTDAPAEIRTALETLKNEPIKNKRILENWNQDQKKGYYILEDGRRSDQMSKIEWETALSHERRKGFDFAIDESSSSPEKALEARNESKLFRDYRLYFEGVLDEETFCGKKIEMPAKWYYYPEPPATLTKYDVISDGGIERYSGVYSDRLLDGALVDELSEEEQFKEFRADYPALYEALKKDIENCIPRAKELKPAQYSKELFTWGELADLDIAAYKHLTSITDEDISEYYAEQAEADSYSKCRRIWSKGIALIANPNSFVLDENGDYLEEGVDPYSQRISIDALAESSEQRRELLTCIDILMKPALSYLYAYNALIDIIAKAYAIEGLEYLKMDLSQLERELYTENNFFYMFYGSLSGYSAERKRKQALIREIFEPIYTDELKPSLQAIAAEQEFINSLGFTVKARKQLARLDMLIGALINTREE